MDERADDDNSKPKRAAAAEGDAIRQDHSSLIAQRRQGPATSVVQGPSCHSDDIQSASCLPSAPLPSATLEQLLTLPMDILTSRDGYRYQLTVLCMLACTCHSLRVATLAERTTRMGTLRLRCSITGPVDYMIWSMLAGVDDRRIWRAILVNHATARCREARDSLT